MSQKEDWLAKARARAAKGKNKENRPSIFDVESTIESYRPLTEVPPQDQGISAPKAPELAALNDRTPLDEDLHILESKNTDLYLEKAECLPIESAIDIAPLVKDTRGGSSISDQRYLLPEVETVDKSHSKEERTPLVSPTRGTSHQRYDLPEVADTSGPQNSEELQDQTTPSSKSYQRYETLEGSDLSESNGFLQLPHQIFQYTNRIRVGRAESAVLSYMLRVALGFQKKTDRVSIGYRAIAKWTGINGDGNVRKAVKSLCDKGIIVRITDYDKIKNIPAEYQIPIVTEYLGLPTLPDQRKPDPSSKSYQRYDLPEVASTRGNSDERPLVTETSPPSSISYQTINKPIPLNKNLNKLLLPENLPFKLKQHLEACSGKHREDEEASLWELLEQKGRTLEEISYAFGKALVLKMKGEGITFPLKFIAKNDFMFYGFKAKPVNQISSPTTQDAQTTEVVEMDFQQAEELFKKLSLAEQEQRVSQYHKANVSAEMALKCAIISFAQEQITNS